MSQSRTRLYQPMLSHLGWWLAALLVLAITINAHQIWAHTEAMR